MLRHVDQRDAAPLVASVPPVGDGIDAHCGSPEGRQTLQDIEQPHWIEEMKAKATRLAHEAIGHGDVAPDADSVESMPSEEEPDAG